MPKKKLEGPPGASFDVVKLVVRAELTRQRLFVSLSRIVGGRRLQKAYIPGSRRVIESVVLLIAALVAGFPVVDVRLELIDGHYSRRRFLRCGRRRSPRGRVQRSVVEGECVLLEPIMKLEVATPVSNVRLPHRRPHISGRGRQGAQEMRRAPPHPRMWCR